MEHRGKKNILELLNNRRYKSWCIYTIVPKACHYVFNIIFIRISEGALLIQMLSSATLKGPLWSQSNFLATGLKVCCRQ